MLDGDLEILHSQRVFGADVHVSLARADGIRADDHALDDAVWIAFHHRAIHECARVAFVGVADDVACPNGLHVLAAEFPLETGRKARAAAPTETGRFDFDNDLLGRHCGERLG